MHFNWKIHSLNLSYNIKVYDISTTAIESTPAAFDNYFRNIKDCNTRVWFKTLILSNMKVQSVSHMHVYTNHSFK
jgi:hypothetical protein